MHSTDQFCEKQFDTPPEGPSGGGASGGAARQ